MLGWVFTGAGAVLLALVFANLGRAFPRPAGRTRTRAGRSVTSSASRRPRGYWIAVWAGNAAIAVAFVSYLTVFWPGVGDSELLRRPGRHRADLAAHSDEHPGWLGAPSCSSSRLF